MTSLVTLQPLPLLTVEAKRPNLALVESSAAETSSDESAAATERPVAEAAGLPSSDYPVPKSLSDREEFIWNEDEAFIDSAVGLGQRLSDCGDLLRSSSYAGGLMLASPAPNIPPTAILRGKQLTAIIADRFPVRVVKDGEPKRNTLCIGHLDTLLSSEAFLQKFRPVDEVTRTPLYLPGYRLTQPGYNDGGRGYRIFYAGDTPTITHETTAIDQFLDVMAFAGTPDRTNAVAAALTVVLHNHFPGGKPLINVTANKSHAGKDTIIEFAAGTKRITKISYQSTDWALERSFVGAVKHSPDTAIVSIENARLGSKDQHIASGFLERFLCDPEPTLFSTGSGAPVRRKNDIVLAVSTNYGSLSGDLMNRALPIHLTAVGNVADRKSPIGNPKLEYLPRHRGEIEAELRGMIERWKEAGCTQDKDVRHPFSEWAAVVGGILKVNGYQEFLANYSICKTVDDPLRDGLALLGAARTDEWLRPADWATLAAELGLVKRIIPSSDQDSDKARARGIGVVLSAHCEETFHVATDDIRLTLFLEKARRRFEKCQPSTRYRFRGIDWEQLPEDPDDSGGHPLDETENRNGD